MDQTESFLEFLEGVNQYNLILYVGTKTNPEDLSSSVCALNWRCVVTSQRTEAFCDKFASAHPSKNFTRYDDLPVNFLDALSLSIIQIYGKEGWKDEGIDDVEDPSMIPILRNKDAEKIMSRIMGRMDVRCKMVVLGYDADNANEYPLQTFRTNWYEMKGGELLFFGMENDPDLKTQLGKFYKDALNRGFLWFHRSLAELLDETEDSQGSEYEIEPEDNIELFYKCKQPVTIKKKSLLQYQYFAQLLTEESVRQFVPLGKTNQARWFYNFLNNSAQSPQWYGYLPQTGFHVKRDFEDPLVDFVRKKLSEKVKQTPEGKEAIILEGDPGSSKSITLAALAYRIFNEKIYPVVFIKNDDLLFNSPDSTEQEQLDELLQEIEAAGSTDIRTLIVWDSATYRNVSSLVGDLSRALENRGRSFLLVCAAYMGSDRFEGEERQKKNKFFRSDRIMSEGEKFDLKKKAQQLMNFSSVELEAIWKRLEAEGKNDIFNYFYVLVDNIRPNLDRGLGQEQRIVGSYVDSQLEQLGKIREKSQWKNDDLLKKLQELDLKISDEDEEIIIRAEEEESKLLYKNIDKLNKCVAMFSRFHLDTPYTLGLAMFFSDNDEGKDQFYNDRDLFNVITHDIPWIHYEQNIYGDFVFRFRNSLEAELFLDRNAVLPDEQIQMTLEMMDYYANSFVHDNCEDENIKYAIQRLIRLMGPNTSYRPFLQGGDREWQHKSFLQGMPDIIDKLVEMRTKYRIPDQDASFANLEITFTREYYGKLWNALYKTGRDDALEEQAPWVADSEHYNAETYMERLTKLEDASDLALETIGKLEVDRDKAQYNEKQKYTSYINTISVESAYCKIAYESVYEEYSELCKEKGKPAEEKKTQILAYKNVFQKLVTAITSDPTNGYAYNALFKLFENEYEKWDGNDEKRLELLSEVRVFADDAMSLEIINRGMDGGDELSKHILNIQRYSDDYPVTIESVLNADSSSAFVTLFNQMLKKNNAAAINFVCQQELNNANLGKAAWQIQKNKEEEELVLSEKQLATCEKILDFMRTAEYTDCVNNNAYSQYIMLQVIWMLYDKRAINSWTEAQSTYINEKGWEEISVTCEQYNKCSGPNKRPIVILIQALAELHLSRDYVKASRTLKSLQEKSFVDSRRMRVPYLFCDEDGKPNIYSGVVISSKNNSGYIKVSNIPLDKGIRFYVKNLGLKKVPSERTYLNNLELGIGFTSFSLYTEEGRSLAAEVK